MFDKLRNLVAVALAIGLFWLAAGQAVAGTPGGGPDSALAPGTGWMPLAVKQQVWYAFGYAGDDSQILVDLRASPQNGASFGVWTPANVASWAAGNPPEPVGQGSANNYVNGGDFVWSGSFREPGTYYVVVNQSGPLAGGIFPTIIGSGVSIRPPAAAAAGATSVANAPGAGNPANAAYTTAAGKTTTPAGPALAAKPTGPAAAPAAGSPVTVTTPVTATSTMTAANQGATAGSPTGAATLVQVNRSVGAETGRANSLPGSGPDSALSPGSGWMPLAVGQQVWYAFPYAGDDSQIVVDLKVSPFNAATFSIWTPATVATWAAGEVPDPVGRGAVDNYVNHGDIVWSGSFNEPGTYYIVVNQAGPLAAGIFPTVSISGVSGGGLSGAQAGGR